MAYNLTENQKELARRIVQDIRNGILEEEFSFPQEGIDICGPPPTGADPNRTIVTGRNVKALRDEGMLDVLWETTGSTGVAVRGRLYEAVDTDFGAVAKPERPSSTMSEYDLTEDQKAILRLLVEHVRTDGKPGDDVWIFFTPHYTKISDFEGDIPPFSRNYLKIFTKNGLMEYHPYPGNPNQYICTLTQKAKDAVDSDFKESQTDIELPPVIQDSLAQFKADHPDPSKVAFIMMQFGTTSAHEKIVEGIRATLAPHGITALRADDKQYHDDLFPNVLTYIYGCGLAVAVFERIKTDDFNPNVSLEVGYMMALGKHVCYLKDQSLKTLPTDLVGKLYKTFDHLDPVGTIPDELRNWLYDKGLIEKPSNPKPFDIMSRPINRYRLRLRGSRSNMAAFMDQFAKEHTAVVMSVDYNDKEKVGSFLIARSLLSNENAIVAAAEALGFQVVEVRRDGLGAEN